MVCSTNRRTKSRTLTQAAVGSPAKKAVADSVTVELPHSLYSRSSPGNTTFKYHCINDTSSSGFMSLSALLQNRFSHYGTNLRGYLSSRGTAQSDNCNRRCECQTTPTICRGSVTWSERQPLFSVHTCNVT